MCSLKHIQEYSNLFPLLGYNGHKIELIMYSLSDNIFSIYSIGDVFSQMIVSRNKDQGNRL